MSDSSSSTMPASPAASRRKHKRRWPRILLWSVASFLILLLLAAGAAVLWLRSAAKAALPQLDGDIHLAGLLRARLDCAGHRPPRRPRRAPHRRRHRGRSLCRPGLRHRAGSPVANGRLPPQTPTANLAEILGPTLVSTTKRSASCRSASPPSASTTISRPPTARASTTTPAASTSSSRSAKNPTRFPVEFRLLDVPTAALDRRGLRQRGPDRWCRPRLRTLRPSSRAPTSAAKLNNDPQLAAQLCRSLPRRLLARSSAHRRQSRSQRSRSRSCRPLKKQR